MGIYLKHHKIEHDAEMMRYCENDDVRTAFNQMLEKLNEEEEEAWTLQFYNAVDASLFIFSSIVRNLGYLIEQTKVKIIYEATEDESIIHIFDDITKHGVDIVTHVRRMYPTEVTAYEVANSKVKKIFGREFNKNDVYSGRYVVCKTIMTYVLHDAFDYRFRYDFHEKHCVVIDEVTEDDIKRLMQIGYSEFLFSTRKFKKNHGIFLYNKYIYNIESLEGIVRDYNIPSTNIIKCGKQTEEFFKIAQNKYKNGKPYFKYKKTKQPL